MFNRLKQRITASRRQQKRRSELIPAIDTLLRSDTQRLIDLGQNKLESFAMKRNIYLRESDYQSVASGYSVGDYRKQLVRYSDLTLELLHSTFISEPTGLNQLVRDGGVPKGFHDVESFFHERLMYPVETPTTRCGAIHTYRMARQAIGAQDMSLLPPEQHSGVYAALTVSAFWVQRHTEQNYVELEDNEIPIPFGLGAFLMEDPDRASDVIRYINEREIRLCDVNIDHLREALTTGSKALSNGTL